jgi:hypothetical protein
MTCASFRLDFFAGLRTHSLTPPNSSGVTIGQDQSRDGIIPEKFILQFAESPPQFLVWTLFIYRFGRLHGLERKICDNAFSYWQLLEVYTLIDGML